MSDKEATARIKINKLLEGAGWRFFPEGNAPASTGLEQGRSKHFGVRHSARLTSGGRAQQELMISKTRLAEDAPLCTRKKNPT